MTGTRTVVLEIMEQLEWQEQEYEDQQQQQPLSQAFVLNAKAFTGTEIYDV